MSTKRLRSEFFERINGASEYSYDNVGRPVRITTTPHPATIASPGVIQSFVYDARGNATGMSDMPTMDSIGASAFDAIRSDGVTRAYGMAYDAFNRLSFVQMYEADVLVGQWNVTSECACDHRRAGDS